MGAKALGLKEGDLDTLAKGAIKKKVLAWFIKNQTMVSIARFREQLLRGHAANVPGFVMCFHSDVPSHTALFCYSSLGLKTLVRRDFQSENGKPEKAKELRQLMIEYNR